MKYTFGFLCLLSLTISFVRFTPMVLGGSSSFIVELYYLSVLWLYPNLFIHFIVDRHLGGFQFEPIMNTAAINILVRVLCELTSTVLLVIYLREELPGHT